MAPALAPELREWERGGEYVEVGSLGHRLFVRGEGEPGAPAAGTLLLLHGFPESSYSFHHNLAELAGQFRRVVLFDMLGYGLSDKPADHSYSLFEQADMALEVWREGGVTGGHLLGHDMGDTVATELFARQRRGLLPAWFSDGFESLTFTNGSMVIEQARLRVLQRLLLHPRLGRLVYRLTNYRAFAQQVRSASGTELLSERDVEILWAALKHKQGDRRLAQIIRYLLERRRFQNSRWLPALRDASTPIHLCWGEADRVAPPAMAVFLKQHYCPSAKLTLMPDVGHFCQMERPDLWNRSVRRFWDELLA